MQTILCLLFCFLAIDGYSQNSESTNLDTASFESKCDCLKSLYELKEELLNNISIDENSRVIIDSTFIERHNLDSKKIFSMTEQCDQLKDVNSTKEPCPYDKKIEGLEDEFQLILRVMKMNNVNRGCN